MKFEVEKQAMLNGLKKVSGAIGKTNLPILNNVLIQAGNDGSLCMVATDTEITIKVKVGAIVANEGVITLPAKKLLQIVNAMPNDSIYFDVDMEKCFAKIECGKSVFRIAGMSADDYPESSKKDGAKFNIIGSDLCSMLSNVVHSVANDISRPVMCGVYFAVNGGNINAVTTDGRRMAKSMIDMDETIGGESAILPTRAVGEIIKAFSTDNDVSVTIGTSDASFGTNETVLTTKLIDGEFPAYQRIIPQSFAANAVIPKQMFVNAVNRASMVSSETSPVVSIKLSCDELTVSANSPELGECVESFEIEYDNNESIELRSNPQFLADAVKGINGDTFELNINDNVSPMLIKDNNGYMAIVMPMRG